MSSTELATVGSTAFAQQVDDLDRGLAFFQRMGDTGLFPDGIKSAADALMVAAAGKRFGFDPLESLQKFHVVKGRVSPSSDTLAGIMLASPLCKYLRKSTTPDSCTYQTERTDDLGHVHTVTYTRKDAEVAGLWGRGTWAKHPAAMMRARCVSAIGREVFPDLLSGMYVADEAREIGGEYDAPPKRKMPQLAPVEPPQQHKTVEPDIIEGELIPDAEPEPKPKRRPGMSPYLFNAACEEMGIDRALLEAAGTERNAEEWNDFRRANTIAKMKKLGRYEYARSIEPSGAVAWALFDALTGGQAGVEADAAGMPGVEAHEQMRGDWLTKHIEAQS